MLDDVADPAEAGRRLAAIHEAGDVAGPSLHDYVETIHPGGWSLRAALVRYAQPEPVRAAALLELTRRADSGLDRRRVEREPVLSDLARLLAERDGDADAVLDAYLDARPLDDDTVGMLAVLAVAARLDALGAVVAAWAVEAADEARPDDEIDRVCRSAFAELDRLGVERQEWYR